MILVLILKLAFNTAAKKIGKSQKFPDNQGIFLKLKYGNTAENTFLMRLDLGHLSSTNHEIFAERLMIQKVFGLEINFSITAFRSSTTISRTL